MEALEIYGTKVHLPIRNGKEYIENWDYPNRQSMQFWRRQELPEMFDDISFDSDGNALLSMEQKQYAVEEVKRCKEGFYFLNNGVLTYITGKNYFYLQWWKLEDDIYPDYRDADRRYFLFLNHWEKVLWCLGIGRGKKRREGASSQATSNLIYECIFFTNSNCGLVSKTLVDSRDTFTDMASFGYNQLPVFLKPRQLNRPDSVSELVFAAKIEKGKESNAKGQRSKINYRAPVENAYDRGRMSRILGDEGGKWPTDVKFTKFISKVSKTMIKGAKRVGFAECPSTVNEMTKGGGAEYKKFWDNANQFKFINQKTPNRFVTYFTPSYDNYEGFIDMYGMSVIDEPTEQQYKYLAERWVVKDPITGENLSEISEEDIRLGARQYIKSRRTDLVGDDLEEEIRQNPTTVKEMFEAANTECLFNSFKINEQLGWMSYNEPRIERGNLVWENGDKYYKETELPNGQKDIKISKLIWVINSHGKYEKIIGWLPKEVNNIYERNGYFFPNGNYAVRIGCDPFKYDKTKDARRSDCAAYVYQTEDGLDLNSPYNDMFVMRYVDRASTTDIQYDHVLKMAWFCGSQVLFERNVNGWKKYFEVEKCAGFLMWLPNEVEPGIYTDGKGTVVQMICDYTESYIEKDIGKVYFKSLMEDETGWLGFEVENTQKYDNVMAAGFALIAAKSKKYIKQVERQQNIEEIFPYNKAS